MPGKIFQFVAVCCSRLAFHEAVVFPWFERTCTSQITNEVSVWFLTEPVKLHKLCSSQCFISSDYYFCFVSLLLPIALVFTCTVRVQWEVSVLSERWTSACTGGFLLSHFNIVGWTVQKFNPPSAAGPPRGRRGPQKVFFVGTPELLVGQLYKKSLFDRSKYIS